MTQLMKKGSHSSWNNAYALCQHIIVMHIVYVSHLPSCSGLRWSCPISVPIVYVLPDEVWPCTTIKQLELIVIFLGHMPCVPYVC